MKIAFFTPLNPIQSGISDYSEELLLAMAGATVNDKPLQIDLFIDRGYRPSNPEITRRFRVLQGRDFDRVAGQYDSTVYQMGNSPAHAYIYEQLLKHPGVTVMHEFVLHHLRQWMALNAGKRKAYLSLMESRYGDEGKEAARRVMLGQFPEALFNFPLSDEAIQCSRGIIVHSKYMERLVRDVRPDVPLSVVPMGVPLPPIIPKSEARARLGYDPDLFLITSVGHLNPYKRVSSTLRAFKALLVDVPKSLYVLVGSRSPNYDPTRQIEMLGLSDKVRTTGYVSQEDLALYLAASDVCINLRHPTAGETSASLLRIMGAGVPVLVSRTGSFEELPDDAVGKVDIDDTEEDLLLEYLLLLARRPDVRQAMSVSARRYVAERHTLEGAARGYLEFLLSMQGSAAEITIPSEQSKIEAPVSTIAGHAEEASRVAPAGQSQPAPIVQQAIPEYDQPTDLVSLAAEVAAEIGIDEDDQSVLAQLARRVAELE
jgi:glycosyltransferase involved in cell wall biosynthesis